VSTGDLLAAEQPSYHFVGIGGVGMSALAYILASQGYHVSGSDIAPNARTRRLESLGVQFDTGHAADHLVGAPQVIYSSAIQANNPEIAAALGRGLSVCHRATLLAQVFNGRFSIGVAGTHGKTTTSSMIGYLMLLANLDPTLIIGGEVDAWGGNARLGKGEYWVAEVDESDGSLVKLFPTVAVITNMELDHPDHYTDLQEVIAAFQQYARQSQVLVASLDCANNASYLSPQLGYTLRDHPQAVYAARHIVYSATGTEAEIWEREQYLGKLSLQVLGAHNLSNALAAIAVGRYLGIEFPSIAAALAEFKGAHRRFEIKGEVDQVVFVDDYAHHPSEVRATLSAAALQNRRILAIFQPHRYSRLARLYQDFLTAFDQADWVVITPVYAAGEDPIPDVSSLRLAADIAQVHPCVHYESTLAALPMRLAERLNPGDIVLFLGAGDLNKYIPATIEAFAHYRSGSHLSGEAHP
jgi:UDP-N-acetylmuramate--alanine ligase